MYKVIVAFHDLQDAKVTKGGAFYHFYNVGDIYPRIGFDPGAERIKELASSDNAQGKPLIKRIVEKKSSAPVTPRVIPEIEADDGVEVYHLDSMTKTELIKVADKYGIKINKRLGRTRIIEQIMAGTDAVE